MAAENGHESIVRLLLEQDQKNLQPASRSSETAPQPASGQTESRGRTALKIAAENGDEAIVRLLLERGAS